MLKRSLTQAQEDLIVARRMIADKSHWCQFYPERNGRHCAIGALQNVLASYPLQEQQDRFKSAIMLLSGVTESETAAMAKVMLINDDYQGHENIMSMFDKAIGG